MRTLKSILLLLCFIASLIAIARMSNAAITEVKMGKSYNVLVATAVEVNASNSSDSFNTSIYPAGDIQIIWADHTSSGATVTSSFKLQSSVDNGSNWDDVPDTSTTTSGNSGSTTFSFSDLPGQLLRVTVSSTAAAGTLTPYLLGRSFMSNN